MADNILTGCDYSALGSKALAGKDIIAMVTNSEGNKLLAVAGQQGLSWEASQETSEASTKDETANGWTLNFHGTKSWSASIDGLFSPDDEATQMVMEAMANDEYLCLKICQRTTTSEGVHYQPLRMGLAIVTTNSLDASNDDNATYSMDFTGSGAPWLYETATEEEREAAAFTVTSGNDEG